MREINEGPHHPLRGGGWPARTIFTHLWLAYLGCCTIRMYLASDAAWVLDRHADLFSGAATALRTLAAMLGAA